MHLGFLQYLADRFIHLCYGPNCFRKAGDLRECIKEEQCDHFLNYINLYPNHPCRFRYLKAELLLALAWFKTNREMSDSS